jgi:hypothetical protein
MSIDPKILDAIDAGLAQLPAAMSSPQARVMLYAIGLQESLFIHRFQVVQGKPKAKGPARGLWQFERGGGCKGVIQHPASRFWMHRIMSRLNIPFTPAELWAAIEHDDALAAAAARLLLFTDPKALPAVDDAAGAWLLYLRTWRPGAWARGTAGERAKLKAKWMRNHQTAVLTAIERAES